MGFLKSVKNIFFKDEIEDDYEEYDEFDEELNKHARTIKSYLDEEDYGKENEDTDNQEFDEYDESSGYETPSASRTVLQHALLRHTGISGKVWAL